MLLELGQRRLNGDCSEHIGCGLNAEPGRCECAGVDAGCTNELWLLIVVRLVGTALVGTALVGERQGCSGSRPRSSA
ncbi:MAG: hypothetical protein AVDCRST_MAG26-1607 [uncultured Chloroflexia bacterium]|uniref:Uncharacterized protein n=1 Tax=uncultured Chloroflexia bacterium TaxID=1672391 RepID=A0A6J4I8V3_9CHLR|nr:MAG: hypothetical protein AVDCRST_MAG26-1607 [uncultured Chloroflexia bacterium]